jgi:hypothetical protein
MCGCITIHRYLLDLIEKVSPEELLLTNLVTQLRFREKLRAQLVRSLEAWVRTLQAGTKPKHRLDRPNHLDEWDVSMNWPAQNE